MIDEVTNSDGIALRDLSSWKEFKSDLFQIIQEEQASYGYSLGDHRPNFLFRGQSCCSWHLQTSFDRLMGENEATPEEISEVYDDMLRSFFDNGLEIGAFNENVRFKEASDFDLIATDRSLKSDLEAYAQHFGLPTRLLDWSESPYVAAFFAAADYEKCVSDKITIWCLDTAGAKKLFEPHELFIQERNLNAGRRQVWQRAAFTINGTNILETDKLFLNDLGRLRTTPKFPVLFRFTIPASEAEQMLKDLDYMRISYLSIYPDIDGVIEYSRFRLKRSLKKIADAR